VSVFSGPQSGDDSAETDHVGNAWAEVGEEGGVKVVHIEMEVLDAGY
jgi:hypothetical protein